MDEAAQDPLEPDAVPVILRALASDEVALTTFTEGLSKHIHFLSLDPGPAAQASLLRFVREWALDVALSRSEAWVTAVETAEARAEEHGELAETATSTELRALLKL